MQSFNLNNNGIPSGNSNVTPIYRQDGNWYDDYFLGNAVFSDGEDFWNSVPLIEPENMQNNPVTMTGLTADTNIVVSSNAVPSTSNTQPANSLRSTMVTTVLANNSVNTGNDTSGTQQNTQAADKEPEKKKSSFWDKVKSVGKEALKIGVVVGASVVGGIVAGPPGAIVAGAVTSAAVSTIDQKLTKGKVDLGRVAIDGVLGGIPGGTAEIASKVGGRVAETIGKEALEKATTQGVKQAFKTTATVGAIDGTVIGAGGGTLTTAYETHKETGKVDWGTTRKSALLGAGAGLVGGVILGGGAGAIGAKFASNSHGAVSADNTETPTPSNTGAPVTGTPAPVAVRAPASNQASAPTSPAAQDGSSGDFTTRLAGLFNRKRELTNVLFPTIKAQNVPTSGAIPRLESMPSVHSLTKTPPSDVNSVNSALGASSPVTRLTRNVDIQGDNYHIVSVPKEIEGDPPKRYQVIGVLDDYKQRNRSVGGSQKLSHGEIVQKFATRGLEDEVAVLGIHVDEGDSVLNGLDYFLDTARTGAVSNLTHLNLSRGVWASYEQLSDQLGKTVSPKNIVSLKPRILKYLSEAEPVIYEEIQAINRIVAHGIDVKVAASNGGPDVVNLLALSNADIVGATNAAGKLESYSSSGRLVTSKAQGTYGMHAKFDENGHFIGTGLGDSDGVMFHSRDIGNYAPDPNIAKYAGKSVHEIDLEAPTTLITMLNQITSAVERGETPSFPAGLYPINDAFRTFGDVPTDAKYVAFDLDGKETFFGEKNGIITVDLDGSGTLGQIKEVSGTSFSAPDRIRQNIVHGTQEKTKKVPNNRIFFRFRRKEKESSSFSNLSAKQERFERLLSGEPSEKIRAANMLSQFPENEQVSVFTRLMDTGNSNIQRAAVNKLEYLPENERYSAYLRAMDTGAWPVQRTAAGNLKCLPENERYNAYLKAMDTGNKDVQWYAVANLEYLPENERYDAYLKAMDTGDKDVQEAAAYAMNKSPEE